MGKVRYKNKTKFKNLKINKSMGKVQYKNKTKFIHFKKTNKSMGRRRRGRPQQSYETQVTELKRNKSIERLMVGDLRL